MPPELPCRLPGQRARLSRQCPSMIAGHPEHSPAPTEPLSHTTVGACLLGLRAGKSTGERGFRSGARTPYWHVQPGARMLACPPDGAQMLTSAPPTSPGMPAHHCSARPQTCPSLPHPPRGVRRNDLRPGISKVPWDMKEDYVLAYFHSRYGNKWSEVAKRLPRRSDNTIKNHWRVNSRLACGPRRRDAGRAQPHVPPPPHTKRASPRGDCRFATMRSKMPPAMSSFLRTYGTLASKDPSPEMFEAAKRRCARRLPPLRPPAIPPPFALRQGVRHQRLASHQPCGDPIPSNGPRAAPQVAPNGGGQRRRAAAAEHL